MIFQYLNETSIVFLTQGFRSSDSSADYTLLAHNTTDVSSSTLKHCTDQLSPVFTDIFCTLLETCHVHACIKTSIIFTVPKMITGLNDYRPVTLISVFLTSFKHLLLSYLSSINAPHLDPLFAYRSNRYVDNSVIYMPGIYIALY